MRSTPPGIYVDPLRVAARLSPFFLSLLLCISMALATGVKIAPIHITASHSSTGGSRSSRMKGRGRKNSIVKVEEIDETQEQMLDQSVYNNMNVEWVNRKGERGRTLRL